MDDRGRGAVPRFQHRELALALRAVRALDAGPTSRGRVPAVLLFSAILLGLLHTSFVTRFPSYPVGATASAAFGAGNEDVSMQFKKVAAVVSSALAVSAGVHAQDAVQWRVEDGGNGHWYERITLPSEISWSNARDAAIAAGGHLVTITSPAEQAWVLASMITDQPTCTPASWAAQRSIWIGLYQDTAAPSYSEPAGGWRWITDEPFLFANWSVGEPNNVDSRANFAGAYLDGSWDDTRNDSGIYCHRGYVIEWSADCNADGIVDYGQIRAGDLEDANANNIPDCCEQGVSCAPCPGDVDESGTVNGVDLAAILAVWGSDGGKYPRADTNNDGEVNGADLATVLGLWGSCE